MSNDHGWIGVDLDGTLAHYDHWRGANHIGEPIKTMVDRVKQWLSEDKAVKIFTARVYDEPDNGPNHTGIRWWSREHIGQELPITCQKDYSMIELWDDRAVQVEINTGRRMDGGE